MAAPKQASRRDIKPIILSLFVAGCLILAVLSLATNLVDQGVFGPVGQTATPTSTYIPVTSSGESHQGQGGGQHQTATAWEATATPRPTLVPHTPQATLPDPED